MAAGDAAVARVKTDYRTKADFFRYRTESNSLFYKHVRAPARVVLEPVKYLLWRRNRETIDLLTFETPTRSGFFGFLRTGATGARWLGARSSVGITAMNPQRLRRLRLIAAAETETRTRSVTWLMRNQPQAD